jgi:succinate dehydrogenase / fumarate reductase cytochrome b subunit
MATDSDVSKPHSGSFFNSFVASRIGSFLAIVPLGVWTVVHLWNNVSAFEGAQAWETAVTRHPNPVAEGVTFAVVLIPLVLHTIWGIGRLFSSRPNVLRYRTYGNLKYVLQRVAAVGVLFFLGAHLWKAFLQPRLFEGHPETFEHIAGMMRTHPPTLAVYLLGTLGVAYHLANGLQGFAMGWGLVVGRSAGRWFEWFSIAVGVILLALSWGTIYALWAAG